MSRNGEKTNQERLRKFCDLWSADIQRSNTFAEKTRVKMEKILSNMLMPDQKKAIKLISDFIFESEEEMSEQIGLLDDKLAELEMTILTVSVVT